jgi:hypothetical protein
MRGLGRRLILRDIGKFLSCFSLVISGEADGNLDSNLIATLEVRASFDRFLPRADSDVRNRISPQQSG